jgi:hypothetical protein
LGPKRQRTPLEVGQHRRVGQERDTKSTQHQETNHRQVVGDDAARDLDVLDAARA